MLTLEINRQELISKYNTIRTQTEYLAKPLEIEDYCIQASDFASPSKWHIAHTTWFLENFILKKFIENYKN